jgi:hypothetical protein
VSADLGDILRNFPEFKSPGSADGDRSAAAGVAQILFSNDLSEKSINSGASPGNKGWMRDLLLKYSVAIIPQPLKFHQEKLSLFLDIFRIPKRYYRYDHSPPAAKEFSVLERLHNRSD